jgi:hypothetical protein
MQTLPQLPQLVRSACVSMQAPEQRVSPDLHTHCRFTQSRVASQALLQAPQWAGFAERSSQPLPQSSVP